MGSQEGESVVAKQNKSGSLRLSRAASLVHSQTRYLPKEADICWTYQIFPKIWSLLGGRYLVGAASARLSGAMGPRYLALVPTSHKISASSRHQISGRGPRDRYLASPGQGICDCSGRYLASPTPDICRWTRRTDIWSAAEQDICPTGPMEYLPGYRVPERKPYRCAHPDNLVPDNQISGHCHVLPSGSASGPTRVAVFNSTSATTAAPSMQRAFPTHGASTTGFNLLLSLAHIGESTPPPAVLPMEAASAQLGFGFRTSSPLVREPNFMRRAVDVYGLKCMTFVCRSSNALGA